MDLTPQEKLRAYEQLKLQEKAIKKEIEKMKKDIVALVPADKEVELEYGVITLSPGRVEWKYSDSLNTRIDEIDEAKTLEQQNGDAKAIMGEPFVTYKERKG